MKKIYCWSDSCDKRRVHHEQQDVMRPRQSMEVPDDHPDDMPSYCSITCACMDGVFGVSTGPNNPDGWFKCKDTKKLKKYCGCQKCADERREKMERGGGSR